MSERKLEWVVWGGLGATILIILVAFVIVPLRAKPLPVLGLMSDFSLTNQDGKTVTLSNLRGNVWVADVIFTRCPGQCPIMSSHMADLQKALPADSQIKLVSFTTDPDFDTPPVLKKYSERYSAREGQWQFLTGTKPALRKAAGEGLKLSALDKPVEGRESATDLFIHSEKFGVLDQTGQIRGYYDGETAEGMSQALAAAKSLARQ